MPPNLFHGIHLFAFLLLDFSLAWSCLHFQRLSFSMTLSCWDHFLSLSVPAFCCPGYVYHMDLRPEHLFMTWICLFFHDIDLFAVLTHDFFCVMDVLASGARFSA